MKTNPSETGYELIPLYYLPNTLFQFGNNEQQKPLISNNKMMLVLQPFERRALKIVHHPKLLEALSAVISVSNHKPYSPCEIALQNQ